MQSQSPPARPGRVRQAAREELLETVWGIRGDECADLPIAVAKELPELGSHPKERTRCLVFGAQNPTPWGLIYRIREVRHATACLSVPIPPCLPAQSESGVLQFPPLVALPLCD